VRRRDGCLLDGLFFSLIGVEEELSDARVDGDGGGMGSLCDGEVVVSWKLVGCSNSFSSDFVCFVFLYCVCL